MVLNFTRIGVTLRIINVNSNDMFSLLNELIIATNQRILKNKNKLSSGSGPKSAQYHRCPYANDSPGPPPDIPGEGGGDKKKTESVLKYCWRVKVDWVSSPGPSVCIPAV